MSEKTEESGLSSFSADSARDALEDWYHIPVLGAAIAFMFWVRIQASERFTRNGEVMFRGNDAWYHYRETMYTILHYPSTMPYEVWTGFPTGTLAPQFGTLFDQITATIVLLVTLGSGDKATAMRVMLYMAPLFGSLVAIPAYYIARRFVGRFGAVISVVLLALLPGTFLNYTLVGFYDHHAAEVLFQSLGVLAFLAAFGIASREKPVWELVVDRDVEALRRPFGFAALAGVAAALYMYVWQPGIILVGFTGIFLVIKITSDVVHGDSPEPVAFVGAVSMTVTGLLMIVPLNQFTFGPVGYTLAQVGLPLAVAAGSVLLAFIAREWESRDLDPIQYPVAVLGLILLSVGTLAVIYPSAYNTIINNLLRSVAFGATAEVRTIGEAQPFLAGGSAAGAIMGEYGLTFFTALVAALVLLGGPLVRSEETNETIYVAGALAVVGTVLLIPQLYAAIGGVIGVEWQVIGLLLATAAFVGATYLHQYEAEKLYLLVWAAFITATAFTQVRFNIYLAVPVVILNGFFVEMTLDKLDLSGSVDEVVSDIEGWQVMTVVTVVLVLIVPLVFVATPAWTAGAQNGPGSVTQWDGSLEWMNDETPTPGELGGADDPMEYYGTYERPADGDFEYPDGAYGVMSWWDYGHWITTGAERIPVANPFQQHATLAANYLLSPSEQQAEGVLNNETADAEGTRYVMVDWQMVNPSSKFGAPVTFYDAENVSRDDFFGILYQRGPQGQGYRFGMQVRQQRYYESMMVRLYKYHGSAMDPKAVVVDWDQEQAQTRSGETVTINVTPQGQNDSVVKTFGSMRQAQEYVDQQDGTAQIGGVGPYPTERVEALEHYRLVHASEASAQSSGRYIQTLFRQIQTTGLPQSALTWTPSNWVKTFERVPGATIEGSGAAPGQEVTAQVELKMPHRNETFTYTTYTTADENGNFEFVVPYSTTGYSEYGPENGYTNVSVRATGSYRIFDSGTVKEDGTFVQNRTTVEVQEGQVNGDVDEPVTVELERTESGGETNESSTNETNSSSIEPAGAFQSLAVTDDVANDGLDAGSWSPQAGTAGDGIGLAVDAETALTGIGH
ncbi:oligosaccharyl transferase, archaeosortase A system-associated [Haloparvum sp. PAK95]|uniref:oligosaccharyl transferase, archaeosortase A system-associated n=1 Tax=Haloparvum sp. PAK95 TaxID=3418962 RepID=UPI003D2EA791